MKVEADRQRLLNLLIGWVLYPLGDLVGQLIMGEFSALRVLVVMLVGGIFYRLEIPFWFRKLESLEISSSSMEKFSILKLITGKGEPVRLNWLGKTIGATLYFNPLWMARHMFFIICATTPLNDIEVGQAIEQSLRTGTMSFFTNLPITVIANYLIQEHLPLKRRFLGSAILTTVLTVKYAIEFRMFAR